MVTLCCTHSKINTPGFFLPVGEQYIEEWSKLGFVVNFLRFLELILVDEFFQSSSLSFWVMNLKNTNKELIEEHTCETGAPEGTKRGQAGRPRVFLDLLHFIFLW